MQRTNSGKSSRAQSAPSGPVEIACETSAALLRSAMIRGRGWEALPTPAFPCQDGIWLPELQTFFARTRDFFRDGNPVCPIVSDPPGRYKWQPRVESSIGRQVAATITLRLLSTPFRAVKPADPNATPGQPGVDSVHEKRTDQARFWSQAGQREPSELAAKMAKSGRVYQSSPSRPSSLRRRPRSQTLMVFSSAPASRPPIESNARVRTEPR